VGGGSRFPAAFKPDSAPHIQPLASLFIGVSGTLQAQQMDAFAAGGTQR